MTFEEFSSIVRSILKGYLIELKDSSEGPYKTFEVKVEQGSLGPIELIYNNDEEIFLTMKSSVDTIYAYECLDRLEELCKDMKTLIKKLEMNFKR